MYQLFLNYVVSSSLEIVRKILRNSEETQSTQNLLILKFLINNTCN